MNHRRIRQAVTEIRIALAALEEALLDEHPSVATPGTPKKPAFDFEPLYELYPRKMGKTPGLKKARSQVKSQQAYDALRRAIENVRSYHEQKRTKPEYIPYFSTFMSQWTDWVDCPVDIAGHVVSPDQSGMDAAYRDQVKRILLGD